MVLQANQLLPHQTGETFSLWILFTEALQTCQHDIKVCWYVLSLQSMQKNCLLIWLLMPWPCYTTVCLVIRNLAVSHTHKTRHGSDAVQAVMLLFCWCSAKTKQQKENVGSQDALGSVCSFLGFSKESCLQILNSFCACSRIETILLSESQTHI